MNGKTLGHYRVGAQLGRGGMGEVYVADDLNLNRKVALKFLPDAFAADPERMGRFEREAKVLASLNHPNIAAIYGLEQAEGKRFIVMELVEGQTLAQRLSKGPLPVDEALGICRQIAEGLEAAHEKGVIHRDLKPANVMITEGDKVKILDFGLAKALSDETQSVDSSHSPTLTEAMTMPGVILGTAAYMSPEQAKGKTVDKRADIWAFGCILYESLTGKRAFEGETVTEILAAILRGEPDWQALPAAAHPNIHFLLRRSLDRELNDRLRDAGDLRILLESGRDAPATGARCRDPLRLAWSLAALAVIIAALSVLVSFRGKTPEAAAPVQFEIGLAKNVSLGSTGAFSLSPDGRHLVFAGVGDDGVQRLWLRSLDSVAARPVPGTESDWIAVVFWAPDSRFVAFTAWGKLKKIDVFGGSPQDLCEMTATGIRGGSWNRDGVIIFGESGSGNGIKRVSATGGSPTSVTEPVPEKHEVSHSFPVFLPDGNHFLFLSSSQNQEQSDICIGSLEAAPRNQSSRSVLANAVGVGYLAARDADPGQLLFIRQQTLMTQPFDEDRLEAFGEPKPVASQVGSFFGFSAFFSASRNGTLAYRRRSDQFTRLIWFDRQGKIQSKIDGRGASCLGLDLSHDGTRAAVAWVDSIQYGVSDIWLLDFESGIPALFTFGKGFGSGDPVWSHDGNSIIFLSNRAGVWNLYRKPVSGISGEELLYKSGENKLPMSWSSDGRFLLYRVENTGTKFDLFILPLEEKKPVAFAKTDFNESDGRFSPDGRWVAYTSDEPGVNEVYVRAFSVTGPASPERGGMWMISSGGGKEPRWREDGRELYYRTPDGKVIAVDVVPGPVFRTGKRAVLFQVPLAGMAIDRWDVTADGKRFLFAVREGSSSPFSFILNWTALLKK